MSEGEYEFRIKRQTGGGDVTYSEYSVPRKSISTVLEGLIYIKEHLDQSLALRYSCTMEICGSCSMEINGKPRMACSTIASKLRSSKITVEPIKHLPVIRDLVVDMAPFFDKYRTAKPYIIREKEGPYSAELRQTPEEFEKYEKYSMCIKCGLCLAACPTAGTDQNYIGPAALASVLRFNLDSRDQGTRYRLQVIDNEEGASRCHFAGECTEVCPKEVNPSFAIQKVRTQTLGLELRNIFRRPRK